MKPPSIHRAGLAGMGLVCAAAACQAQGNGSVVLYGRINIYPNATELMEQWTNVRGVSQTPTSTGTWLKVYGNNDVRLWEIPGMGHGLPIDPGSGSQQCGTAAAYFLDYICSAYHDAVFFGLSSGTPPSPGPTPTPSPTQGSVATFTPPPTLSPVPATPTPTFTLVPTSTPRPTSTPASAKAFIAANRCSGNGANGSSARFTS